MLFVAILTAVSEKIAFNLTKIIQGAYLGPFAQKVAFGKVTYGPFHVFIRFLTVYNNHNRKDKFLSFQGQKT
jgi:hypothetical protein